MSMLGTPAIYEAVFPTNLEKFEPNLQGVIDGGRRPKSGVTRQAEMREFRDSWLSKTNRPLQICENYPLTERGRQLPCFVGRNTSSDYQGQPRPNRKQILFRPTIFHATCGDSPR